MVLPKDDSNAGALPGEVGPLFTRFDNLDEVERDGELNQFFSLRFYSGPYVVAAILVHVVEAVSFVVPERPRQLVHQCGDCIAVTFQGVEVEQSPTRSGNPWSADGLVPSFVAQWDEAVFENLIDCSTVQLHKRVHQPNPNSSRYFFV